MEAMFDDVGSKSLPRGVKILSFRENRRLGGPFWRQDGNINFSKTRPECRGTGKTWSAWARPAAEAWPREGKGGDKPLPGWTPELDSVVLHGVQHSSGAAPD